MRSIIFYHWTNSKFSKVPSSGSHNLLNSACWFRQWQQWQQSLAFSDQQRPHPPVSGSQKLESLTHLYTSRSFLLPARTMGREGQWLDLAQVCRSSSAATKLPLLVTEYTSRMTSAQQRYLEKQELFLPREKSFVHCLFFFNNSKYTPIFFNTWKRPVRSSVC